MADPIFTLLFWQSDKYLSYFNFFFFLFKFPLVSVSLQDSSTALNCAAGEQNNQAHSGGVK